MSDSNLKVAMFGAGCFWGVEAEFRKVSGVTDVSVGYSGGHTENPTYEDVCSDKTGYVEVVRIEFDSEKVTYGELLDKLWEIHDPTTQDRQGVDHGSQYRSMIFYFDEEQKRIAEESKEKLDSSGKFSDPVVTEIVAAGEFYRAEDYHQNYLSKQYN